MLKYSEQNYLIFNSDAFMLLKEENSEKLGKKKIQSRKKRKDG